MTVFVAVQAPELVSRDLRSRVLPLYFSRPIEAGDYPLAKYLGFTAACLVMLEVPLLLLYGGAVANVHGGAAVWAQTRALVPGLLVGLMWAVALAAISLLLASLTGRRGFATGAVAIGVPAHLHAGRDPAPGGVPGRPAGGAAGQAGGAPRPRPSRRRCPACSARSPCSTGCACGWAAPTRPTTWPAPGAFGAVYALVLIALVAGCLAGLGARYRKASLS